MKIKMLDKTLKIFSNKKFFKEDIYVQIPDGYLKPEGTLDITDMNEFDVTEYATAKIKDDNLKPENIAEGVEVLGIIGTFKGGVDTSDGTITPDKVLKDKVGYAKDERVVGTIETWDGSFTGDGEIYNHLNEYLKGNKTKITKDDLEGLTELRVYAFAYSPITEVEFPDKLVRLGDRAFYQTKITSINLEGITYVGQYAFSYSTLEEVRIPASVTSTGQRCFENCKQLKKVVIECRSLAPLAFQYDTALEEIVCLLETPPTIYTSTFTGTTCPIKVRADLVDTYKNFTNWTTVADRIVAYEGD